MITIRQAEPSDTDAVWSLLQPVFRAGETYAVPADISKEDACAFWLDAPARTYVALLDSQIVGTYYIKTNHPGGGAHICNCGYVVSDIARGQGIAGQMCLHSMDQARALGYRAMQYNLVLTSNTGAVRLWEKLGFAKVGTIPQAFRHPKLGFVDAYVMYQAL